MYYLKRGRPPVDGLNRSKLISLRISPDHLKLLDDLVIVLNYRLKNMPRSRTDILVYLIEKEYQHQQKIKRF